MRISDWSSDVCSSDLGDNEQVVRKCECTDHAVERETCIEDFEIKEGAEARLCYLPGGCDRRFEDMVHNLDADEGQQTGDRSEEHTSELQSLMRSSYAVFCLNKKRSQWKLSRRQLNLTQ